MALTDGAALIEDAPAQELFGLASSIDVNLVRLGHGLVLTTRREARLLAQSRDNGIRSLRSDAGITEAVDHAILHGIDVSGRFQLFARREDASKPTITRRKRGRPLFRRRPSFGGLRPSNSRPQSR